LYYENELEKKENKAAYFDRTGVYYSLFIVEALCDCVFRNDSLSRAGMSGYQNAFISLDRTDGDILEGI
jgi:hypothetical protein